MINNKRDIGRVTVTTLVPVPSQYLETRTLGHSHIGSPFLWLEPGGQALDVFRDTSGAASIIAQSGPRFDPETGVD
jgi:hypothetical protein